jgi:hypothetical protein
MSFPFYDLLNLTNYQVRMALANEAARLKEQAVDRQRELNMSGSYQDLVNSLENRSINDLRQGDDSNSPLQLPGGEYTLPPAQRYVRDPLDPSQHFDMKHFFAAAYLRNPIADDIGFLKEVEQWARRHPSGFNPIDFRSNQLGELFGVMYYDPSKPLKPQLGQFFDDYVNRRLPLSAYAPWDALHNPLAPFMDELLDLFGGAKNAVSPLVLDLDGDGIELISLTDPTRTIRFDHDLDGMREATGWVQSDDGLLVIDINDDGIINDSAELFGTQDRADSGFNKLKKLDQNGDNWVSTADTHFGKLQVWRDLDYDGFSDSNELFSLAQLGISRIRTTFTKGLQNIAGNEVTDFSTYELTNGTQRQVVDVWFAVDKVNSRYDFSSVLNEQVVITEQILALPTLSGYGKLPDLDISMAKDQQLFNLVSEFQTKAKNNDFTGAKALLPGIMFRWAKVDGVVAGSRGANIDARVITFLERYLADSYLQGGTNSNPAPNAADQLQFAFDNLLTHLEARLFAQIITTPVQYDSISDRLTLAVTVTQTRQQIDQLLTGSEIELAYIQADLLSKRKKLDLAMVQPTPSTAQPILTGTMVEAAMIS